MLQENIGVLQENNGVFNENIGVPNQNSGISNENIGFSPENNRISADENVGDSHETVLRWVSDDNDYFPDSSKQVNSFVIIKTFLTFLRLHTHSP